MLEKLTNLEEMDEETKSKIVGGSQATDTCFAAGGGIPGTPVSSSREFWDNVWALYADAV